MERSTKKRIALAIVVLVSALISLIILMDRGTVIVVATADQEIQMLRVNTPAGPKKFIGFSKHTAIGIYFARIDSFIQVSGTVGGHSRQADFGYASSGQIQIARVAFASDGSFRNSSTWLP